MSRRMLVLGAVVGVALLFLWLANRSRRRTGGTTTAGNDPGITDQGTQTDNCIRWWDLARALAPDIAILPNGYDPCNYYRHIPTGRTGTLEGLHTALGTDCMIGTPEDAKQTAPWGLFYDLQDCLS